MFSARNHKRWEPMLGASIGAGCLAGLLPSPPLFAANDQVTKPTFSNTVEMQTARIIGAPDGGNHWGSSPQKWLR
jgi:hypothetical protein